MSPLLLIACRGCRAPVDPGPRAHLSGRMLLDLACARCGKRALYEVPGTCETGY